MFDVNLFADDTVLILKSKSIDQLQEQANEQLNGIDKRMKCNRLSINYSKTTGAFFIACPKRERKYLKTFSLKIGKYDLLQKDNGKYLGAITDKDLKWNIRIEYATKKLANAARILCKIRHKMSAERRYLIYITILLTRT